MKEVVLSIAERLLLIGVFNSVKGDVVTLRAVLEDVKDVAIGDEEKKEINLREVKDADGKVTSLAWDKSEEKTVKLSESTVKFVLDFIKSKSDSKELTLADQPLLLIEEKLSAK